MHWILKRRIKWRRRRLHFYDHLLDYNYYFFVARVVNIWTGGNDLKDDNGNFVFAIDNSEFSFDNLEFGTGNFDFIILFSGKCNNIILFFLIG